MCVARGQNGAVPVEFDEVEVVRAMQLNNCDRAAHVLSPDLSQRHSISRDGSTVSGVSAAIRKQTITC